MKEFTKYKANEYIKKNRGKINLKYYPDIHLSAPIGWINDPNGVSFFNGLYHVFYQYYPYDSIWGPMHWGHSVSSDLINWQFIDVALAPDQPYDKDGCFSGSSLIHNEKIYLMYTGHVVDNMTKHITQIQNIAVSSDGKNFEKSKLNPVIGSDLLPVNIKVSDFRDPKLFKIEDKFYVVIGAKTVENKGAVLLFESNNLLEWKFKSKCVDDYDFLGSMIECPDYFTIDDKEYMIFSVMDFIDKNGEKIAHRTFIATGFLDISAGKFLIDNLDLLDYGKDFYAPQTMMNEQNERIMFSWMQNWTDENILDKMKHRWSGQMSIPRKLYIDNGILKQDYAIDFEKTTCLKELKYKEDKYIFDYNPKILAIKLKSHKYFKLKLLSTTNDKFTVCFENNIISNVTSMINNKEYNYLKEAVKFDLEIESICLIIDNSSIEFKISNKKATKFFSYLAFPEGYWNGLVLEGLNVQDDFSIKQFEFKKGGV